MEYTFSSNDLNRSNQIICPINYLGASIAVRWYISYINGKSNVVLLDQDDYITINDTVYHITDIHTNLENLITILNNLIVDSGVSVSRNSNSGCIIFNSDDEFTLGAMSIRMRYATGFYYNDTINITSIPNDEGPSIIYEVKGKAYPFDYLTPIWYAVSNLGSPCQVSTLVDRYKINYPAINAKIINTFTPEQSLSIANADYQTVSRASSLSNLIISIVDSNMYPIRFLSPIYITVCVEEVPLDDNVLEALQIQEPNKEYIRMLREYTQKQLDTLQLKLSKLEAGITVEPDYQPMEYTKPKSIPEYFKEDSSQETNTQLREPAIIDDIPVQLPQETPQTLSNPDLTKNDDTSIEKENGVIDSQKNHIDEAEKE